jgi:5-formyltetrahydrofolate cyclo-ligase
VDLDVDLDPDLDVDIVLAPALAVDTQGRRIGLGGDGYDEILRRLDPATLVLVAVHDDELFDSAVEPIPEEPHDVRVDAVLTPSRIRYLTA